MEKVEMTLGRAKEIHNALQTLGKITMPAVACYRIGRLINAFAEPAGEFDKTYNALLQQFGTPIKDQPGRFSVTEAGKLNAEVEKLIQEPVTVDAPWRISIADFGDAKVEPVVFATLSDFITE